MEKVFVVVSDCGEGQPWLVSSSFDVALNEIKTWADWKVTYTTKESNFYDGKEYRVICDGKERFRVVEVEFK